MRRGWAENLALVGAGLVIIGLAYVFGIWAVVLVALVLLVLVGLIVVIGGGLAPPPDKGDHV